MARIVEDSSLYETWKSVIQGTIVLRKIDRNGDIVDDVVLGGKVIQITPTERRFNQEACAAPDMDVFQNGMLTPVRLIESAEDVETLKGNPNHMSESDMEALFKVKTLKGFEAGIAEVTNPITLRRLVEMAESEQVSATVKQLGILKSKLDAISPSLVNEVHTVAEAPKTLSSF